MSISHLPAKALYLANRHPRLTREAFAQRWLHHSRMGDVLPDPRLRANVSSLRYCLTLDPAGILPLASNEHDGVSLLGLRSVVSIPTIHQLIVQNDIAFADELRTFERPVDQCSLYMASELLLAGAETDVAVIELARSRADVACVDHLKQADGQREPLLAQTGLREQGLRRWVRNVAVAPGSRGFTYDLVNELWFDSVEQVAAAAPDIERLLREGVPTDAANSLVLLTRVIHRIGRDRP